VAILQAGFMKMQVSRSDIQEILTGIAQSSSKLPKGVTYQSGPEYAPISQELNVIGERAEEARDRLEKFLDDAVMARNLRVLECDVGAFASDDDAGLP